MSEGYAKVKDAAQWAGVSERTFRDWLKDGMPHIRLKSNHILIKYEYIDQWLNQFEVTTNNVDELVEKVMEDFNNGN